MNVWWEKNLEEVCVPSPTPLNHVGGMVMGCYGHADRRKSERSGLNVGKKVGPSIQSMSASGTAWWRCEGAFFYSGAQSIAIWFMG